MLISGFTVVKNALLYNYPVLEAIHSILPICNEFVVNVGKSDDNTLKLIRSIQSPKIRVIETDWDKSQGPYMLAHETNVALAHCKGTWAFYVQADEVIHQADLPALKDLMQLHEKSDIEAMRFRWMHFYGSFYRYRIDAGWFQKQNRIIRNNRQIESYGDAFAFRRKDGGDLKFIDTGKLLYHYGWVHNPEVMNERRKNHAEIGFELQDKQSTNDNYDYGNLNRFPVYFGTHPAVMNDRIKSHELSGQDLSTINRKYWWFPPKIFKVRYKTGRRVKEKII